MKSNFRFFLYLLLLWFPFSLFFLHSFISQKIRLISQCAKYEAIIRTLPPPWQVQASISFTACRYHLLFRFLQKTKSSQSHIEKCLSKVYSRSFQTSETILKNSWQLIIINYFWKNLHLKYLRGFKIHVCLSLIYVFIWKSCSQLSPPINFMI